MKITQNGRDVANGFDNMYYIEMEGGEWNLIDRWSRPHNCTSAMCEFLLVEEKEGRKMLLGSSANSNRWIGREVDSVEGWTLDQMAEYLDA